MSSETALYESVLFATAIGPCGIAWRPDGLVVATTLPEGDEATTRRRLRSKLGRGLVKEEARADSATGTPITPPGHVAEIISAVTALLDGEPIDLDWVPLDLASVGELERAVYEQTREIGPGQSATYGQIAVAIGEPGSARAVGRALGQNPWPIIVPCHRVLGAGGELTGFSAAGGISTKRRMLLIEGCPAVPPSLFD